MLWIWLSVILISFGGIVSFLQKDHENKILPFSVIIIFCNNIFIFYKGLEDSKIYTPDVNTKKRYQCLIPKNFLLEKM